MTASPGVTTLQKSVHLHPNSAAFIFEARGCQGLKVMMYSDPDDFTKNSYEVIIMNGVSKLSKLVYAEKQYLCLAI